MDKFVSDINGYELELELIKTRILWTNPSITVEELLECKEFSIEKCKDSSGKVNKYIKNEKYLLKLDSDEVKEIEDLAKKLFPQ